MTERGTISYGRMPYAYMSFFELLRRNEYDRTIAETEHAYAKILESSQTLLNVLKKETQQLTMGGDGRTT